MTKPRPFGHYFILEKIAQGGMAEIFKGLTYDFSGIKKFIVIKRILPHIAANHDFINMLISEAKIAVSLSHGNIAQIYDLGKVGNDYFIVMEYVDGKSLSQILKKCQAKGILLPVEYCLYFIAELCNGLDHMHRKKDERGKDLKIVHRDISPQNVIVSYSGNVKIVDFGVAKAAIKLGETEGDGGVLKGKFAYMSPEQAEGKEIDFRSDLFSAGIVLWELLTAQRLFKKKSNSETVEAVKKMVVLPPSQFRPDISPELDQIVLKSLSKDSAQRYASAHDLSLDLTKHLLRNYSDFKPSALGDFLQQIFDHDEDVTGSLYLEKTQRGDRSSIDNTSISQHTRELTEADEALSPDVTQVVAPEEIDFRSIFDEISWDEESEIEKKEENEDRPTVEPVSELPDRKPDEELSMTSLLPLPEEGPLESSLSRKRGIQIILGGLILLLIILFIFKLLH